MNQHAPSCHFSITISFSITTMCLYLSWGNQVQAYQDDYKSRRVAVLAFKSILCNLSDKTCSWNLYTDYQWSVWRKEYTFKYQTKNKAKELDIDILF